MWYAGCGGRTEKVLLVLASVSQLSARSHSSPATKASSTTQKRYFALRIDEIRNGMRNVHIEGKIIDMNQFMLVLDDESGRTFVRYNFRNLVKPVQKGDYVKVDNGVAVNYSGILQLKLPRNGLITPTQVG